MPGLSVYAEYLLRKCLPERRHSLVVIVLCRPGVGAHDSFGVTTKTREKKRSTGHRRGAERSQLMSRAVELQQRQTVRGRAAECDRERVGQGFSEGCIEGYFPALR